MTRAPSVDVERSEWIIAMILRLGAYTSFVILALASVLHALHTPGGTALAKAGILLLIATPVMRILAAIWMYSRSREYRMLLISLGVLGVILLGALTGLALH
jgi:uncharacterized membrane protein